MIDVEKVKRITVLLGGYDDGVIEKYSPVIENAVAVIGSLLANAEFEADTRAVYLAAARANYDIVLAVNSYDGDNVTSFTAGDVKIIESDTVAYAERLYKNAQNACKDILADSGFCFKCV